MDLSDEDDNPYDFVAQYQSEYLLLNNYDSMDIYVEIVY
jgi:hypothetical protein